MCKTTTKVRHSKCQKKPKKGLHLDTLAQLSTDHQRAADKSRQKLIKRQKAKAITIGQIFPLIDLDSPLKKSYWNTYHCSNVMIQEGHKLTSKYCNARWCTVCNRIRMAKMINAYSLPLIQLGDLYFMTLTAPNVKAHELKDEISGMLKSVQRIRQNLHKQGIKIKALRKLECTYNPRTGFNPHIHAIITGKKEAQEFLRLWLQRYPQADMKGQDIRKADGKSIIELFKYTVKGIHKGKYYAEASDTIYQAMYRRRTFQPIGITKVTEEDIDGMTSEPMTFKGFRDEVWQWSKESKDWMNQEGELLTGHILEGKLIDWVDDLTSSDIKEPEREITTITLDRRQRADAIWGIWSEYAHDIIENDTG